MFARLHRKYRTFLAIRELASLRRTEDFPLFGCWFVGWAIFPSIVLTALLMIPYMVLAVGRFEMAVQIPLVVIAIPLTCGAVYCWISIVPMLFIGWFETLRSFFGEKKGLHQRMIHLENWLQEKGETHA